MVDFWKTYVAEESVIKKVGEELKIEAIRAAMPIDYIAFREGGIWKGVCSDETYPERSATDLGALINQIAVDRTNVGANILIRDLNPTINTPIVFPTSYTRDVNWIVRGLGKNITRLTCLSGLENQYLIDCPRTGWGNPQLAIRLGVWDMTIEPYTGGVKQAGILRGAYCIPDLRRLNIGTNLKSGTAIGRFGGAGGPTKTATIEDVDIGQVASPVNIIVFDLWLDNCEMRNINFYLNASGGRFLYIPGGESFYISGLSAFLSPGSTFTMFYMFGANLTISKLHVVDGGANVTLFRCDASSQITVSDLFGAENWILYHDAITEKRTRILDSKKQSPRMSIPIWFKTTTFDLFGPGSTTWVECPGYAIWRINLTPFRKARLFVCASGTESGSGKGLCVYNKTDDAVLVGYEWSGTALQHVEVEADISTVYGVKDLSLYGKGSSASENLQLRRILLTLY